MKHSKDVASKFTNVNEDGICSKKKNGNKIDAAHIDTAVHFEHITLI